jgi:hypothetical protein
MKLLNEHCLSIVVVGFTDFVKDSFLLNLLIICQLINYYELLMKEVLLIIYLVCYFLHFELIFRKVYL